MCCGNTRKGSPLPAEKYGCPTCGRFTYYRDLSNGVMERYCPDCRKSVTFKEGSFSRNPLTGTWWAIAGGMFCFTVIVIIMRLLN